jgi:hypothetical protein
MARLCSHNSHRSGYDSLNGKTVSDAGQGGGAGFSGNAAIELMRPAVSAKNALPSVPPHNDASCSHGFVCEMNLMVELR